MQNVDGIRLLGSSVLVLNRFYLALHVVSARRAFAMLYREAAEVIDVEDGRFANYDFASWCEFSSLRGELGLPGQNDDWVRAVNFSILVPRVIRLVAFDRKPRQTLRFSRKNLFARDGNRCQYCGNTYPGNQLSIDHVIPRSRGGGTSWENVVCACVKCNTRKGGRTPQEARMKLLTAPVRPKQNPLLTVKLRNPKYQSWRNFLPK